ncbi:MAG: DUF4384 domain-containing protein [Gemmatimonadales bacterium]
MLGTLTLALAALSAPIAPTPATSDPSVLIARWVRGTNTARPRISVWVNREDPYQRGDRVRVYFKSDEDTHVTVVRIDTDGRVRILFPIDPWEDNWARGGKTFEVLGRDRDEAFRVDDYPGAGYIFAIASEDPFSYDDIIRGDHWDYHTISEGRVRGDPYVAVSDLAERISGEDTYDYDVTQYDVEKHYDYPRFVCYDCHGYASWHTWNPYYSSCSRFRIVIYDDWYYYPYRRYNRGIYVGRPYRPGPRYVFKDHDARNDYVTRVAQRPRSADPDPRRPVERDRTSQDVGGRGSIPIPGNPRRRTAGSPSTTAEDPRRPEQRGETTRDPSTNAAPGRSPGRRGEPSRDPGTTNGPDQSPERRAEPSSQGGGTREVPDNGSPDSPRRRPQSADTDENRNPAPDRGQRSSPSSEPSPRAEPRREPPRDTPRASSPQPQDRPRAEPRSQPPQPRSTGEPQLKRRRP